MNYTAHYTHGFSDQAQSLYLSKHGAISITALGSDQLYSYILRSRSKGGPSLAFNTEYLTDGNMKYCQVTQIKPPGAMGKNFPSSVILQPFELSAAELNKAVRQLTPQKKVFLRDLLAPFIDLIIEQNIRILAEHELEQESSDSITRLPPRPLVICTLSRDESTGSLGVGLEKSLLSHLENKGWLGELIPSGQEIKSQDQRFAAFSPKAGVFYKSS